MPSRTTVFELLSAFAQAVAAKRNQLTMGEPEEQLRAPFETFVHETAAVLNRTAICTGETPLPDQLGRPDFAVHVNGALTGYVELKATGTGANPKRFSGHNKRQWKRFQSIPNLLYSDGNEWALFRNGEQVGPLVRMTGDIAGEGSAAVQADDAEKLARLIHDFLDWEPFIPVDRRGKIDLKGFADILAPLCRMLRNDVVDALANLASPLVQLATDWRQLLFPEATDDQFADAYAQTVAFALLLGRSEGADPLTLDTAQQSLAAQHNLLSRALQVLTDPTARTEMAASLNLLVRVIGAVPPATFNGPADPWLYFYEDFLAAYDPKLRKDAGTYYTPIEVVRCQVRLIDDLLVNRLEKPLGFADPDVITLDPATGTATYLLGVIDHALDRVKRQQGPGAVAGQATTLVGNLYGFELMVGPYAVTELRVTRALRDHGATLPPDGARIYLTDTLESPDAEPPVLPFYLRPISEQHEKALRVKSDVSVIVCLGNPPYDRHEAAQTDNRARTGGWVRWGDSESGKDAIFQDFLEPAMKAGHGVHAKNLYNLYVYFWRWALWKVFEHKTTQGPGVVSFISASSYLDGDAFCGMREHMRRVCDEIWILDLGGEGRGTRKSDNVFAIQTPVAIAIAFQSEKIREDKPAKVHYARIEGNRQEKLDALDAIADFSKVTWLDCLDDWHASFRPYGNGDYFTWPLLTALMPWQHSGCEVKRTWPICHDVETLRIRWKALLRTKSKPEFFRETRDRQIRSACSSAPPNGHGDRPLIALSPNEPPPRIVRYPYRSFDRQWIFADNRLGDYLRPVLWHTYSPKQIYLVSSLVLEIGAGSAISAVSFVPDRHYFAGRGGKDILPLYRDAAATEPNLLPALIELLKETYKKRKITPEDLVAYIYGILAQPEFTRQFEAELESRELRVPITKKAVLFEKGRKLGARLLWLHTYGERFVPRGKKLCQIPTGKAKCTKAVPGDPDGYPETFAYDEGTETLHVGEGAFAPVAPEVYAFEVSGLKVVQSWLKYRMRKGAGKKSSPLDDIRPERWTRQFTTELLELLWVLEATRALYPEQAKLLDAVMAGPCFQEDELPPVPDSMRKPPTITSCSSGDLLDGIEGA